ncbi:MAG: SpoIIE family protein phosphatase [Clostridia bacterium]|nr:SpoIIE family protein phosphatase [Clostridia bacterium]
MKKNKSLGRKIQNAMIWLVIALLLAGGVIFAFTMVNVSDTLVSSNRSLSATIEENSSAIMAEQSQQRILELAGEKAKIADELFSEFRRDVCITAAVAEHIYNNPGLYSARSAPLPDPANEGTLTVQTLFARETDPRDPKIKRELELIANIQDLLFAINESRDSMPSNYVATESGIMVLADYISDKKFDEAGNLMPLDARERPWYIGAAETGEPYFTPVTKDAHTPRLGIMCGVPIYVDGKLKAVAGAGMALDDMETLVKSADLSGGGNACILNENGQVLFSTYEEGTLAAVIDAADLRESEDGALAAMAKAAVGGESGVTQLSVDGAASYAAYSPMKTVGWSIVIIQSQEVVEAPTKQLLSNIGVITDRSYNDTTGLLQNAAYMLLALLAAAIVITFAVSFVLSRRIVMPIRKLTEEVGAMEGEKLDFEWDLDTGDETQLLANSFRSLTLRMKDYIRDIETITAEKERIGIELSLATRIQADMLPNTFPAYPERPEFDIYASMEPAREVGGDFYDFFLIDDDHLCMVMADVSGKGVPAALFMMAAKIILKNNAMTGKSPAQILTDTNSAICDNNQEDMFVTVWLGILEISTGRLTAANAGHEYPVFMRDGKFSIMKDKHGFVIGGMEGVKYKEYEVTLRPGEKVFLYTDGVPEATDAEKRLFGTDRMLEALNSDPYAPPEGVLSAIRTAVDDFVRDAEQFDDLTMLCVEYKGNNA